MANVCRLCRMRHRRHYAESRTMPNRVIEFGRNTDQYLRSQLIFVRRSLPMRHSPICSEALEEG